VLIDALRSQLFVVDLQEKLLPVIAGHERRLSSVPWLAPLFRAVSREFLRG